MPTRHLDVLGRPGEAWDSYFGRANSEVLSLFTRLVDQTDFGAEARDWKHIVEGLQRGTIVDPTDHRFFVAYFCCAPEIASGSATANHPSVGS